MNGTNIEALRNMMRGEALKVVGDRGIVRQGTLTSYDPQTYRGKVALSPEDVETGWLPIAALWAGGGWGLFAPPVIGTMVAVEFWEGSVQAGFITHSFHNEEDPALVNGQGCPSGELWLVHMDGHGLKLLNDGRVRLFSTEGIEIGNAGSTMYSLVTSAFMALFNAHTHPVTGSTAGPTTTPMTLAHLTTITKAN